MALSPLLKEQDLPPRISSTQVQVEAFLQQVASAYRPVGIQLAQGIEGALLSFDFPTVGQVSEASIVFKCHGNTYAWHFFEVPDFSRLKPELAGIDLKNLPEELAIAALEVIFDEPLQELSKAGLTFKLESFKVESTLIDTDDLLWSIKFPSSGKAWKGFLRSSEAGRNLLTEVITSVAPEISEEMKEHSLDTALKLGSAIIPDEQWNSMNLHDVIVIQDWKGQLVSSSLLINGQVRADCALDEEGWKLAGSLETTQENSVEGKLILIATPVQAVSVGEIQNWNTESALPFTKADIQEVTLYSQGQRVGSGEWLTIGDQPAVRITQLL